MAGADEKYAKLSVLVKSNQIQPLPKVQPSQTLVADTIVRQQDVSYIPISKLGCIDHAGFMKLKRARRRLADRNRQKRRREQKRWNEVDEQEIWIKHERATTINAWLQARNVASYRWQRAKLELQWAGTSLS